MSTKTDQLLAAACNDSRYSVERIDNGEDERRATYCITRHSQRFKCPKTGRMRKVRVSLRVKQGKGGLALVNAHRCDLPVDYRAGEGFSLQNAARLLGITL